MHHWAILEYLIRYCAIFCASGMFYSLGRWLLDTPPEWRWWPRLVWPLIAVVFWGLWDIWRGNEPGSGLKMMFEAEDVPAERIAIKPVTASDVIEYHKEKDRARLKV